MEYYIITNASRASHYGIGTYVGQLANALKSMDGINIYSVDLYADVNNFHILESNDGVIHLQFPPSPAGIESESYCRSVYCLLSNYINNQDVEHSIFHFNYFQHYPLALAMKSRFPQSRILLAVHYFDWCFTLKGNITRFRNILKKGNPTCDDEKLLKGYERDRKFLCLADTVVALSEFAKEIIKSDYKITESKIRLVYNGLDNKAEKENNYLSHKGQNRRKILFVGRLDEIKGVVYLAKAFCKLASVYNDLQLYVVGDGNYDNIFTSCHEVLGRVIFTGRLPKDVLCKLYDETLFGVLPSFHEQCSYSAIEFMMNGIPFIGTDSTGLGEMLSEMPQMIVHIKETDFSEESFVNDLAKKMDAVIKDSELRKEASKKMHDLYDLRYTISEMSKGMGSIIEGIKNMPMVSGDGLSVIDEKMFDLIRNRPDIDLEFYGMTGIGVYLWWRLCSFDTDDKSSIQALQDTLADYIHWLYDTIVKCKETVCCVELSGLLISMLHKNFCDPMVHNILALLGIVKNAVIPSEGVIVSNALKIVATKI